jgi:DNA ligase-associated metallophosphoesterase
MNRGANLHIDVRGENLWLSPARAAFWEGQQALVLSDLHIGKGGHFRKAGIPIPGQVQDEDLGRLGKLAKEFDPKKIVIVGDMFHSHANSDLIKFQRWREQNADREVILVKGNHDILQQERYAEMGVQVEQDGFALGGFSFFHQPLENAEPQGWSFSGHLHPGVLLKGNGKQQLRLPCFWLSSSCMVLPAFSSFTGLFLVKARPGEKIIAIVDGGLIPF